MSKARRARDIPEGFIDDHVSLSWLEWHGGMPQLTTVGKNIVRQITATLGGATAVPDTA